MLTLAEISEATRGKLITGRPQQMVGAVSTDTRAIAPGSLFVPLVGERYDGHEFVATAIAQGATAVLLGKELSVATSCAVVAVENTLLAYGRLAHYWRSKLGLPVIAVTGSTGKTSTKETIYELLGRFLRCAKSQANFNNEIGVPRTLLELRPGIQAAVVEFGMRGSGEIAYLTKLAQPDVGVITNIGSAHIGRLGSQAAIAAAKGELVQGMPDGRLVLNGDDPWCRELGRAHPRVCYFSLQGPAMGEVWAASALEPVAADGWSFRVSWCANQQVAAASSTIRLALPGRHHMANALAAIAVAWQLGIALPSELTLAPLPVGGRNRVLAIGDIEIFDDSYNANPDSARAALDTFCQLPCAGRRITVWSEMAELGEYAAQAHRTLGLQLDDLPIDLVVTVGELAELIAMSSKKPSLRCPDNCAAVNALQ
ncbi:MAG: UDP-N-acetylmuramoyl-tripeptide--D-alanyl-D-alanine ligase, partial [Cyanobacteria bacterium NC_groundwater_1444_Ag_S-0.65um_54_12]|nr:UDP-N-acetylmuramoyl-tripeptide--D-alanyl-D-alanine ligase [Cyanobacteria bacterium NC_groundwater_1444_Ag_S-0.65um_54_12]